MRYGIGEIQLRIYFNFHRLSKDVKLWKKNMTGVDKYTVKNSIFSLSRYLDRA